MGRFKNITPAEGIGFGDVEQTFTQGVARTFTEFQAVTPTGQDVIALEVIKEYKAEIQAATGVEVKGLNPSVLRDSSASLGDLVGIDNPLETSAAEFEAKVKALNAKDPSKFKLKSLEDLKDEFVRRKDIQFEGEQQSTKPFGSGFAGGALGVLADPLNILTALIPIGRAGQATSKVTRLAAEGFASMLGEVAVQANVTETQGNKALAIAGAFLGPGVMRGLGIGAKATSKVAIKGVEKLRTKSGSLMKNLAKNTEEILETIPNKALKETVQSELNKTQLFKGKIGESLENMAKASDAFENYKPIGNSKTTKIAPKPKKTLRPGDAPEVLDEFDAFVKEFGADAIDTPQSPIATSTGKHSTYIDPKTGKSLNFETFKEAENAVTSIKAGQAFDSELQAVPNPKGGFTLVDASDATFLQGNRSFKSAAEAQKAIEKAAIKADIPASDIKVLKSNTPDGTPAYKLAVHASEGDIVSSEKGLMNSFDGKGQKVSYGLTDGVEETFPAAKAAQEAMDTPEIPAKTYEKQLDQIMADDTIKYEVPGYGDKTKFKKFIDDSKKAIAEFNDCIGG